MVSSMPSLITYHVERREDSVKTASFNKDTQLSSPVSNPICRDTTAMARILF